MEWTLFKDKFPSLGSKIFLKYTYENKTEIIFVGYIGENNFNLDYEDTNFITGTRNRIFNRLLLSESWHWKIYDLEEPCQDS